MNHEKLALKEPMIIPTNPILEQVLGDSYVAYEAFQKALPKLNIEQEWQWYTPYKAWFAKGQYRWITQRGAKKKKSLYWLYTFEGYFDVAVWFKEKNREEVLKANISEETLQLILETKTMGKLPTFPVVFKMTNIEPLEDICSLIELKKEIEK